LNPPTKQKKRKKKKKKKPKGWRFEDRIKKVTDSEMIHIDWDAPPMHSPSREVRQSWTIYNDPDDHSVKYDSRKGEAQAKPHKTIEKSVFKKKEEKKVIASAWVGNGNNGGDGGYGKEGKVMGTQGEKGKGNESDVKENGNKNLSSCRFVECNKSVNVYTESFIDENKYAKDSKIVKVESGKINVNSGVKVSKEVKKSEVQNSQIKIIKTTSDPKKDNQIKITKSNISKNNNLNNSKNQQNLNNIKISGIKKILLGDKPTVNKPQKKMTQKNVQIPIHKDSYTIQVKNPTHLQPQSSRVVTGTLQT
jgi:hypothetical protein